MLPHGVINDDNKRRLASAWLYSKWTLTFTVSFQFYFGVIFCVFLCFLLCMFSLYITVLLHVGVIKDDDNGGLEAEPTPLCPAV